MFWQPWRHLAVNQWRRLNSISSGHFKDVELTEGRGKTSKPRFYESVIARLTKRLRESNLVQKLKAFDKCFWPGEQGALTLYGKQKVCSLAKSLGEPVRKTVEQFRDWKLQATSRGKTLERLYTGFSAINDTAIQSSDSLREESLSSLLFVDLNGPPLDKFDPVPYMATWIKAAYHLSSSWIPGRQREEAEPRPLW